MTSIVQEKDIKDNLFVGQKEFGLKPRASEMPPILDSMTPAFKRKSVFISNQIVESQIDFSHQTPIEFQSRNVSGIDNPSND